MTRNPTIGNLPFKEHSIELSSSCNHHHILAAESYSRALEFISSMNLSLVEKRPSQVIKNGAQALEFGLRAVLLHSGHTDDWIACYIGRDLEAAMALTSACGLPPPTPEFASLLPELSRYHTAGRNFGVARILSAMNSRQISDNVVLVIDLVGPKLELKTDNRPAM